MAAELNVLNDILQVETFPELKKYIFLTFKNFFLAEEVFILTIGTNMHQLIKNSGKTNIIKDIDILKFEKSFLEKEALKITPDDFLKEHFYKYSKLLLLPLITNKILRHIVIIADYKCSDKEISFASKLLHIINERIFLKEIFLKKDIFFNEILKNIRSTILVRDANYNILYSNKKVTDVYKCYELEFQFNSSCDFCPLNQPKITKKINDRYYKIEHGKSDNNIICIIEDITQIMNLKNELSNAEKLSFIGKVSSEITHEIKNPLNAIQLKVVLLENIINRKGFADEKVEKIIKSIRNEILRLSNITGDFLKLGKNISMSYSTFFLDSLIKEIISDYNMLCLKNNILLEYENFNGKSTIYADRDKIKQAFINLLKNSLEELSELEIKSKRIKIELKEKKNNFEVFFSDNGRGIKEPSELFTPFYTTKKNGSGLGLSITKKNISAHNGTIEFFRKNNLSFFKITLPKNPDKKISA